MVSKLSDRVRELPDNVRELSDLVQRHTKVFKQVKDFDRGHMKIEASIVSNTETEVIFDLMAEYLVASGARILPGQAPPGYLEDQIQAFLESMKPGEL
jgi:hypothetical protein